MNATKYIAGQFGHPTGISGWLATRIMNLLNRKQYKACCRIIPEYAPKKILDIGAGNGYALARLYDAMPDTELYGIDISEDAVRLARRKLKTKATLCMGDVGNLPFESDFFEAVFTINTFYFWDSPEKALEEIRRVLTVNGIFINICYTKQWLDRLHYTRFGFYKIVCDEMVGLHRNAGFSSVELFEIEDGKSFYILCKK